MGEGGPDAGLKVAGVDMRPSTGRPGRQWLRVPEDVARHFGRYVLRAVTGAGVVLMCFVQMPVHF